MRGFVLVRHGLIVPESFRFSRESCKGVTANWKGSDDRFHTFNYWKSQGYRVKAAWLELAE
jgi:hypothetical protein